MKKAFLSYISLLLLFQLIWLIRCEGVSAQFIQGGRIHARTTFTYERRWNSGTNSKGTKSRRYEQRYDLGFRGFIWDYRFMSLDSNLRYSDGGNVTKDRRNTTDNLEYGFSSTLLTHPRFKFPLTFFASKKRIEKTYSSSPGSTRETRKHGVRWRLKFVRLPETDIKWQRDNTITDGIETRNADRFNMYMRKSIKVGRTTYKFSYRKAENVSANPESNAESDYKSFYGTAYTKLSDTTTFDQGVNYFTSDSRTDQGTTYKNTLKGYRANLTLQPTSDLYNSLSYSYSDSKDQINEEEFIDHWVSARTAYKVNARLSLSTSIGYFKNTTLSPDSPRKRFGRSGSIGVGFRLTKRTNTHSRLFYNTTVTQHGLDSIKETRIRKGASAGISHSRSFRFRWVVVGASYGIGFHLIEDIEHDTTETRDKQHGLSQNADINVSSLGWKYLNLKGIYKFVDKTGTSRTEEERSHRFRIDAQSNYFSHTDIRSYVDKYIRKRYSDIKRDTTTFDIKVIHDRMVWRGVFRGATEYRRTYSSGELSSVSKTAGASYRRMLARNLRMSLSLGFSESYSRSSEKQRTIDFVSKFNYRLRAWLVSLEYDYRTRRSFGSGGGGRNNENRIYITLTRSFAIGV